MIWSVVSRSIKKATFPTAKPSNAVPSYCCGAKNFQRGSRRWRRNEKSKAGVARRKSRSRSSQTLRYALGERSRKPVRPERSVLRQAQDGRGSDASEIGLYRVTRDARPLAPLSAHWCRRFCPSVRRRRARSSRHRRLHRAPSVRLRQLAARTRDPH